MDETTRDAEIARARTVLRIARWRVRQDIEAYGCQHVSKINAQRYADAAHRLNWLLGIA